MAPAAACVLVVEDDRKIRDLLRSCLEHDGLTVIAAGSGAEAITFAGRLTWT
jgi:CheY-like chemotaxis protein